MRPVSLTTERLRRLLVEIRKRQLPYEVCLATDVHGPGGGVYVKSGTPVSSRHIVWIESRNPSRADHPTFIEVYLFRKGAAGSDDADLAAELDLSPGDVGDAADRRTRAAATAEALGRQAMRTAGVVTRLHEQLGRRYTRARLSAPEAVASFQEFDREYRRLHQVVRQSIDEFLGGNTLVMDFIVDYELERPAVRHALRVAALATELLVRTYPERCAEEGFRRQLVDLFMAGFLHDSGMWDEPYCFAEGHETRGAALAAGAVGDQASGPRVEKLILFHSQLAALAAATAPRLVRTAGDDLYETRFDDGGDPADLEVVPLSEDERTLAVGLALAETWVTEIDQVQFRFRNQRLLLNELVQHAHPGPGARLLTALCNMDIETVAPRRAWVTLTGSIPVQDPKHARGERYLRVPVDGFTAASLGHEDDGGAPHLLLLYGRTRDGSREPLQVLKPGDAALWERSGGPGCRCYVPGGRYKNLLDWEVTGFLAADEYETILGAYERQARRRGLFEGGEAEPA